MWKCSNSSCHNSPDNINCKFVLLRWLISGAKVLTTTWLQFPTLCQLEISLRYSTFHTQKIFQIYFYICVVLKFDMTGIWGDVCEVWHDMWDLMWRCDGSQMRADIRKSWQTLTSQHLTSENFWHFCTSISHILNIMWIKYSGFNKNWEECWAQTVTDPRAPPSLGSVMTRCSQELRRESAMSLIRSSNKPMKRVRERWGGEDWGTTWYWPEIRFFVKLNLSVSRLKDGQFV